MIGGVPFVLVVLLLADSGYSVEGDSITDKCLSPDASVCQNDVKDCLEELYNVERECSMQYPDLYEGRLDADFSMKMKDGRKGKFLIAVYNGVEDLFIGIVEDCCGIEVGKNCTLRPTSKDESFYIIYLDDKESCYWDIQEFPIMDSWCDEKKENRPCFELNEKGEVVIYSTWVGTNLAVFKQLHKAEYCFFDMVPDDFVRNGTKREDGFLQIEGFELSKKKPTPRISGVNESCFKRNSDEVDLKTYWEDHNMTLGYTTCFIIVKAWKRMLCYEPPKAAGLEDQGKSGLEDQGKSGLEDQGNKHVRTFWITLLGIVAIIVVTICALFALWFCRRSFPSFRHTEKQISDTMKNIESGKNLLEDDQNLDEKKNEVNEIPDEIVFKDENIIEEDDDDVTPMLPEQPQTYSNFDDTIDAGCDRGFSSSPLPALRGNISDEYIEKWAAGSTKDHTQHPSSFDLRGIEKAATYQNSDKAHFFVDNGNDPIQSSSSAEGGFGLRSDESVSRDQNSDEAHISMGSGKDPTAQPADSGFDVCGVERASHDQNSDEAHSFVENGDDPIQSPSSVDSGCVLRGDEKALHDPNFNEANISVGSEKEPTQFSFHVDSGFDLCGEKPSKGDEEVFVKSNFGEYTKKSFLSDNGTGHVNPCPGTLGGYVQKAIA